MVTPESFRWFSVRCVFRVQKWIYEERIVLTRAVNFEDAIRQAEVEGDAYAEVLNARRLDFAQVFDVTGKVARAAADVAQDDDLDGDEPVEIFSLMRDSHLKPKKYLDRFFDTGAERQTLL